MAPLKVLVDLDFRDNAHEEEKIIRLNEMIKDAVETLGLNHKVITDGYHTFEELYEFRMLYNAAYFNMLHKEGEIQVTKSKRHFDGEECFGGGWFIVTAELPSGQISNHYKLEHWDKFLIPALPKAPKVFDGHTPKDVVNRLEQIVTGQRYEEITKLSVLPTWTELAKKAGLEKTEEVDKEFVEEFGAHLLYFGTELTKAGHYFFSLTNRFNRIPNSHSSMVSAIGTDPEAMFQWGSDYEHQQGKGKVGYLETPTHIIIAVCGAPGDVRNGSKSVFIVANHQGNTIQKLMDWLKLAYKHGSSRQGKLVKQILKGIGCEVEWPKNK